MSISQGNPLVLEDGVSHSWNRKDASVPLDSSIYRGGVRGNKVKEDKEGRRWADDEGPHSPIEDFTFDLDGRSQWGFSGGSDMARLGL